MYWKIKQFFTEPVYLVQQGNWTQFKVMSKEWAIRKAREGNLEVDQWNSLREFPDPLRKDRWGVTKRLGFKLEEVSILTEEN